MDQRTLVISAVTGLSHDAAAFMVGRLTAQAACHGADPDAWIDAWVILRIAGITTEQPSEFWQARPLTIVACLRFSQAFGVRLTEVARGLADCCRGDSEPAFEFGFAVTREGRRVRCSVGTVSILVARSNTGIVSAFTLLSGYLGRRERGA